MTQLIRLFLDKHISRNIRLLFSLVCIGVVFLLLRLTSFFIDIRTQFGKVGICVCMIVTWLVFFIAINLIADKLSARMHRRRREAERVTHISKMLNTLSASQRGLLGMFVRLNTRQLQDYEIGGFKAVWGRDMAVLIEKRIVAEPAYGVYEIDEDYFYAIAATL